MIAMLSILSWKLRNYIACFRLGENRDGNWRGSTRYCFPCENDHAKFMIRPAAEGSLQRLYVQCSYYFQSHILFDRMLDKAIFRCLRFWKVLFLTRTVPDGRMYVGPKCNKVLSATLFHRVTYASHHETTISRKKAQSRKENSIPLSVVSDSMRFLIDTSIRAAAGERSKMYTFWKTDWRVRPVFYHVHVLKGVVVIL